MGRHYGHAEYRRCRALEGMVAPSCRRRRSEAACRLAPPPREGPRSATREIPTGLNSQARGEQPKVAHPLPEWRLGRGTRSTIRHSLRFTLATSFRGAAAGPSMAERFVERPTGTVRILSAEMA
jgi:hypothetical protein